MVIGEFSTDGSLDLTRELFYFDKMCFSHYDKINENDYHIKGS